MGALLVALLLLAGVGKAVADAVSHGAPRLRQLGPAWRNETSWQNKYRDYTAGDLRPRFFGATTVFVFVSDAWHAANAFTWLCWAAAAGLACWLGWPSVWWLAAGLATNKLIFEPVYRFLRR